MRSESGGRGELADFLRSRRARLRPDDVGLVSHGPRRVPGLRREELAQLAGVSPIYYTRLEQGQSTNASESVIDAIARALALTDDERAYLHELTRPRPAKRRRAQRPESARRGVEQLIAAMRDVPAIVLGRHSEVLAWNELAHLLFAGHYDRTAPNRPADRPNLTRMLFLDPHTRELYRRWDEEASRAVASLRVAAGRYADDPALTALVGELIVKSPEFAACWAKHPVQVCGAGTKYLHHPVVGDLELDFEALHLPEDDGHRVLTYTPVPGSGHEAALQLLKSSTGTAVGVRHRAPAVEHAG
ncbi:helix-turn-helix transcriptional regulator [Actinoplanes teichomyceticus]|uniref:Transcriptional regulator with XRE-family HTH domain n=1 Tax=Actinoplanes teichomyceticus TaxID=1867 RepID=A0A561WBX8_ACTTI|nr:helix-turn-helix transcriptional regulator [Actinoplanes teichomyceticus]TWG21359.1 transcriptional regulator with XRE-family HTH domain [Actinoplanes teichomyceticus]